MRSDAVLCELRVADDAVARLSYQSSVTVMAVLRGHRLLHFIELVTELLVGLVQNRRGKPPVDPGGSVGLTRSREQVIAFFAPRHR
jgi:hypothetical protein